MKEEIAPLKGYRYIPPRPDWKPYCLSCTASKRMTPTNFGWRCDECGNEIGKDLLHYDHPKKENHGTVK